MKIRIRPDAIPQALADHNISRDELARRMGVSSSTALRVQQGITEPSPKFIAALIVSTGRPFEELFVLTAPAEVA